ncbi:gamma-butyrobetaine dioxygenase-like isoform X1 [Xenia sp. Carnegie-2017]|uniref:gamma-butyrobetaine dioxygenase-like isoform X1 n=1 Tax=Xenia sp. Carnegie-2017 TaxID=2897299 RepID=UPI001F04F91C|nr:gamma-butyrobetaine dioxygenase-like isoform X1 [Xenia sp. Carnegie-2017]
MSSILNAFKVASLSNCRDFLRIVWQDGRQSKFSNIWLRSAVRDPKFFDANSLLYRRHEYVNFIANHTPLMSAECEDHNVVVKWENHSSNFDASWLRAHDGSVNDDLVGPSEVVLWDSQSEFPVTYHYSERAEKLEQWMTDLRKYGVVYFVNVPANEKGLDDVMQQIGVLQQRFHPTNKIPITSDPTQRKAIDRDVYSSDYLSVHTDTAYHPVPYKLSGLIGINYDAPIQDTESYFVDNLRIIGELQKKHPEAYDLLQSIPVQLSRRRMNVQEKCDPADVRMYQYDLVFTTPLISYDHSEGLPTLRFTVKHSGFEMDSIKDHSVMEKYYKAFLLLESMLSDPFYHQKVILNAGTLAIFNNSRVAHGRGPIHPMTSRFLYLGFMSEEMWRTRWRLILGEKSGLPEKWLYGCSDATLQVLAKRKISENVKKDLNVAKNRSSKHKNTKITNA